jgi:hypothetical protein
MAQEPPKDISVDEVLNPGTPDDPSSRRPLDANTPEASEVSRILAKWLDNWIRIPGTDFRIGLDPIVSIFPGVGDFFASSAGLVILLEGIRLRVSVLVLAQMGMNLLLNAVMNLIPGAGIIASTLYKSNNRNLTLLRKWQEGHAYDVRRGSFVFFIVLILLFLAIVTLWISLWIAIIWVIRNTFFAWL